MNTTKFILICLCSLTTLIGCSGGDDQDDLNPVVGEPVETNSPNTNYAPAFAGQTRIGGVNNHRNPCDCYRFNTERSMGYKKSSGWPPLDN